MFTKNIGYGVEIGLEYGRATIPYTEIKRVYERWGLGELLDNIQTYDVEMWFEGLLLFFVDLDGNREVFDRRKWGELLPQD